MLKVFCKMKGTVNTLCAVGHGENVWICVWFSSFYTGSWMMSILLFFFFFLHNLEIKYDLQSNSLCCRFLWVSLSHRRDQNFILAEWSRGGGDLKSVRGADLIQGALYGIGLEISKRTTLVRWLNFVESTIYQMVWSKFCISCIMNEIQTLGHPASVCFLWTDVIALVLKLPLLLVGITHFYPRSAALTGG